MGEWKLDTLAAPAGERTVVFVGEYHREDRLSSLMDVCSAFSPDVIALESDADRIVDCGLDRVIERAQALSPEEDAESAYRSLLTGHEDRSALTFAALYAAHRHLPLYLVDWHPLHPGSIGDYFAGGAPRYVRQQGGEESGWKGLADLFEETIETLFGFRGRMDAQSRIFNTLRCVTGWDDPPEKGACQRYNLLCETVEGMAIRNEYTAQALNLIPGERILYVGGIYHFLTEAFFKNEGYRSTFLAPLQDLAEADNRYYVHLAGPTFEEERLAAFGTTDIPVRCVKSASPALEWERLGHWARHL